MKDTNIKNNDVIYETEKASAKDNSKQRPTERTDLQ